MENGMENGALARCQVLPSVRRGEEELVGEN